LTSWLRSFLLDRSVKLRFNGFVSDLIVVGAPQGSPISPVRSIIYTYPLLLKMHQWNNSSLSMYVDDGLIFACGASYDSVSHRLRSALQPSAKNGSCDRDLVSSPKKPSSFISPVPAHWLYARLTYYRIDATNCVRYLGFHIDFKLQWKQHISIVANRVKSTLKSLQLLGNSVRGLDFARWRLAICLPVLTYGVQLWYKGQVVLVKRGHSHRIWCFQNSPR
jgi:hypothetical protein